MEEEEEEEEEGGGGEGAERRVGEGVGERGEGVVSTCG